MSYLQDTEDYLITLIKSSPFGVIVVDMNFNLKLLNQRSRYFLFSQTPLKQAIRKSIFDLIEINHPLYQLLQQQQQGRFSQKDEFTYQKKSYRCFISLITSGLAIFLEDITEEIQQKKQLESLSNHLKTKNKELNNIAQLCAHNLKSPIISIYDLCELIKDEPDNIALQQLLQENAKSLLDSLNYFTGIVELHADDLSPKEFTTIPLLIKSIENDSRDIFQSAKINTDPTIRFHFSAQCFPPLLTAICSAFNQGKAPLTAAFKIYPNQVALNFYGIIFNQDKNISQLINLAPAHLHNNLVFLLANIGFEKYAVQLKHETITEQDIVSIHFQRGSL